MTSKITKPSVVALGGGHGLAAVLSSLKLYSGNITGIVSVADDGGSSGHLREDYGIPAPGDVRRCVSALADEDSILASHLEDRFADGVLGGHPIGNLLLAGLSLATNNFQSAVDELCRIVGAAGRLYPATVDPVVLLADTSDGTITGQVAIEQKIRSGTQVDNLRFDIQTPKVSNDALSSIEMADQIVLGPGSLLTSVIAAVTVPDILSALNAAKGKKVFVANIKIDTPNISDDSIQYQADLLASYGVKLDFVVCPSSSPNQNISEDCSWITADVLSPNGLRHDPSKLAKVLAQCF